MKTLFILGALVYITTICGAIFTLGEEVIHRERTVPSIEYYVQVELGASDFGIDLPGLNHTSRPSNAQFGEIDVFNLNITDGIDRTTSQNVGSVRGFTIQSSYLPGASASRDVEVEVLTYDDGNGLKGTIMLQGIIENAPNEIAIVGGTGSFRGVRGYAFIDIVVNNTLPYLVYHHSLFFM